MNLFNSIDKHSIKLATAFLITGLLNSTNALSAAADEVEASKSQPYQVSFSQSPTNALQDYMDERGWYDVQQQGKFRIFRIGVSNFSTKDPRTDKDFLKKRTMAASIALLNGKAEIIKTIRTKMSAKDLLITPGNDIEAELNKDINSLLGAVQALQNQIWLIQHQGKSIKQQQAEQQRYARLSLWRRVDACLQDADKQLQARKQAQYQNAKLQAQYNKLAEQASQIKSMQQALLKRADTMIKNIAKESKTSVQLVSSMPLYGVATLATEERFDANNNNYEVGILLVWSQKYEATTRAILTGQFDVELASNSQELRKHLFTQREQLVAKIGTGLFKDSNGNPWVYGVGVAEVEGNNSSRAKGIARIQAQKQLAISLYSFVSTKENYQSIVRENKSAANENITEAQALESFAQNMEQSFQNRVIQGAGEVYSREVIHPVTGKRLYLSFYGISAATTQAAKNIETLQYQLWGDDGFQQKQAKKKEVGLVVDSLITSELGTTKPEQESNTNSGVRSDIDDDDF